MQSRSSPRQFADVPGIKSAGPDHPARRGQVCAYFGGGTSMPRPARGAAAMSETTQSNRSKACRSCCRRARRMLWQGSRPGAPSPSGRSMCARSRSTSACSWSGGWRRRWMDGASLAERGGVRPLVSLPVAGCRRHPALLAWLYARTHHLHHHQPARGDALRRGAADGRLNLPLPHDRGPRRCSVQRGRHRRYRRVADGPRTIAYLHAVAVCAAVADQPAPQPMLRALPDGRSVAAHSRARAEDRCRDLARRHGRNAGRPFAVPADAVGTPAAAAA